MSKVRQLENENQILKSIIKDIWWMARRYADGRLTYAPGLFNGAMARAKSCGMEIEPDPICGGIVARYGDEDTREG